MAIRLQSYFDDLGKIRKYLIKIGPARRLNPSTCAKKFCEAENLIKNFQKDLDAINLNIKHYKPDEVLLISTLCDNIRSIFENIDKLCVSRNYSEDSSESENYSSLSDSESSDIFKMEKFDLKTAVSLLPVMNDKEDITKQLISAIEMYESMLEESSKKMLISFVLKTRLSEGAKLRLSQTYNTIKELVDDMKKHLLVKKSFTAIQQQLLRTTQNQRSIEAFGKEIENLFVELTISQSDGDSNKYEILKPLNEKLAIKTFSNGLRNGHISTIISARNYSSLREAIRGAKDEEMSTTSTEGTLMGFSRGKNRYFTNQQRGRGRCFNNRGFQANHRGQNSTYRGFNGHTRGSTSSTSSYRGLNNRGGRSQNTNRFNNSRRNNNVNYMTSHDNSTSSATTSADRDRNEQQNSHSETQFFRSLS